MPVSQYMGRLILLVLLEERKKLAGLAFSLEGIYFLYGEQLTTERPSNFPAHVIMAIVNAITVHYVH